MANLDEAIRLVQPMRSSPARPTPEGDSSRPSAEALAELRQVEAARIDLAQFAPLYESHVDLVWRYAMARLGDHHRAADATSITFQRAIAALPRFQPRVREDGTTFRAWLMTIARNVVIDEARRQPETSLDQPTIQHQVVDQARSPEEQAIASDERRRVMAALDRLPETPRQIVELRLIGMKVAEIADILGMSQSAVKTAHFRAHARLRELLTVDEDQDPTDE